MDHTIYLALGSNLDNRLANLKQAIASLSPQMEVKAKSRVYETPPWGYEDQPMFLSQVLMAKTYLEPEPLLRHLKRLEVALIGRNLLSDHHLEFPNVSVPLLYTTEVARSVFGKVTWRY